MQSSTKWIIGGLVVLGASIMAAVVIGMGVVGFLVPVEIDTDSDAGAPTVVTEVAAATPIPDGAWFGFVTAAESETGEPMLGVDRAEMLSGSAAYEAAVEAGVIGVGEEVPNDFFIHNPESIVEMMPLDDGITITVLSGNDPASSIVVDADQLTALFDGTYVGPPVYGVVAHEPIAMDLLIRDGRVAAAQAVYLP